MPWAPQDADKHVKGLSARQRRVWARVANSALAACLARGGKQGDCEGSALAQAASVAQKIKPTTNAVNAFDAPLIALRMITVHTTAFDVRFDALDDREYVIAPVVAIVAGVLNNHYVPAEEIAMTMQSWEGAPVPLGHPVNEYGDYISARTVSQVDQNLGFFFNVRFDRDRLRGEVWLDISKCEAVGGDAVACLRRLEIGESIECSTAFFSECAAQQGIYAGVRFEGIHRHLRPDHLALLPNEIGACSIEQGCGLRNHHASSETCHCGGTCASCHQEGTRMPPAVEAHEPPDKQGRLRTAINALVALATGASSDASDATSLATHLTHDDIAQALCSLLSETLGSDMGMMYGSSMLVDVQDGFVIYKNKGELYRQAYTVDEAGVVALSGAPEDVQRNTQYLPLAGNAAHQPGSLRSQQTEGGAMKPKAELVQALIAHQQTTWEEKDRRTLDACDETFLARLLADADTQAVIVANQATTQEAGQGTTAATVATNAQQAAPVTLEALKALLDDRDKALDAKLEALTQQHAERAERTQLVTHLQAQGWTEQECAGMPLETLRKVVQTVSPVSYAGMGFPAFPGQSTADADLPDDEPTGWRASTTKDKD